MLKALAPFCEADADLGEAKVVSWVLYEMDDPRARALLKRMMESTPDDRLRHRAENYWWGRRTGGFPQTR